MEQEVFNGASAKIESGRIRIPDRLARCINWLHGDGALNAWLLILQPGRFRLLSDGQVETSERLKEVLQRIKECQNTGTGDPITAESLGVAALSARLVPTVVSPKGPGWRLTWPKDLFGYGTVPSGTTLYLLVSDGYLEFWLPDLLNRALEIPLDQVLS